MTDEKKLLAISDQIRDKLSYMDKFISTGRFMLARDDLFEIMELLVDMKKNIDATDHVAESCCVSIKKKAV